MFLGQKGLPLVISPSLGSFSQEDPSFGAASLSWCILPAGHLLPSSEISYLVLLFSAPANDCRASSFLI